MSRGQSMALGRSAPEISIAPRDRVPVAPPRPVRLVELALLLGIAMLALVTVAPALAPGHAGVVMAAVALASVLWTHGSAALHARLAGVV